MGEYINSLVTSFAKLQSVALLQRFAEAGRFLP
jgi:hypothetical protein